MFITKCYSIQFAKYSPNCIFLRSFYPIYRWETYGTSLDSSSDPDRHLGLICEICAYLVSLHKCFYLTAENNWRQ